tara:strand:+ start:835 stop:1614 length:780 start_codon:yes stop_codon:yes gene_type:complete
MSLTNKTISSTYKDVVSIDNSNAGFDANIDQIRSGNGNGSALYLSTNNLKVQPSTDSTTNSVIYDKDGNTLFQVDSTNDAVKALGSHVNTQYKEFGLHDFSPVQGYHSPLMTNNMIASSGSTLYAAHSGFGGNGTDPATTLDVSVGFAFDWAAVYWYIQDDITIDAVRILASCNSSENLNFHIYSYDLDTSSNHGDLSNGTLIAHINSVMAVSSTTVKTDTLVIDSASISANKIVIVFVENEDGTGDITCQATVKYHLT